MIREIAERYFAWKEKKILGLTPGEGFEFDRIEGGKAVFYKTNNFTRSDVDIIGVSFEDYLLDIYNN